MFDTTDVLIAGAGPVGLMLAAELRRDGVNVARDRCHDERTFFVQGAGRHGAHAGDFRGSGHRALTRSIPACGSPAPRRFRTARPCSAREFPRAGLPYGALSLAQFETERILEAALARNGGHVEYGATLVDFTESGDTIDAHIQDACGESRTIRCRWLVGCDGARSTVRRQLNVAYEGDQYPQTFMLADLDVEWNLPRGRCIASTCRREGGVRIDHARRAAGARLGAPLSALDGPASRRCRPPLAELHARFRRDRAHHAADPAARARGSPRCAGRRYIA